MHATVGDAWYLLRCRENYWQTIQRYLHEAGLKTCCPLILERRRRKDKRNSYRLINSPAFPGYIFVKFNPEQVHTTAIKRIPGAMDFVRFGNQIATIPQCEIEALKLVHNGDKLADTLKIEASKLPDEVRKRIGAIITAQEPGVRIDLMFSMLTQPTRPPRSSNAS